tara:strand:+ start:257 stop:697 length:441 start_codon:yes stop_codon:yes gene_type:complete
VNAEVTTIYEKDHWKVNVVKYDDGTKACTATVYTDEIILQIYRSKEEYTLETYYDDYTNKKLDFFKFRIDNNQPWKDEEPVYDNGWLMSDIFSYSDEAAQKIEKEMRAGRKFYQMDENEDIAWFSLIGSNKAFNVFDECVSKGGNY